MLASLISACAPISKIPVNTGSLEYFIQITPESDTPYTNPSLKKFMTNNEGASVVVRDNKAAMGSGISGNSKNSDLCSLIESALVRNHYNVRDRQIFEQVMSKMGDNVDYVQLSEKTGTDLIFEVIEASSDEYQVDEYHITSTFNGITTNLKPKQFYSPSTLNQGYDKKGNKLAYRNGTYYNAKGKKEVPAHITPPTPMSYTFFGYHIAIKVIMLRENKVGGTYRYYYTPCNKENGGCKIKSLGPPTLVYYENNDNRTYEKSPERKSSNNENSLKELGNFISNVVIPSITEAMKE
jgi:hypothetical protein